MNLWIAAGRNNKEDVVGTEKLLARETVSSLWMTHYFLHKKDSATLN